MSIHLVGRLAMVAGQSCIAGLQFSLPRFTLDCPTHISLLMGMRPSVSAQWHERVCEHVICHAPALGDPLGLVECPVDTKVDAALAVLFLGLRERREAPR